MNSNATAAHSDLINVLLPCHLQFIPICLYLKIQWYNIELFNWCSDQFTGILNTVFSRDKFMKIFENYHEFGDTYFAQCFGSNQYEKLVDMSKYLKTHVLWTHILCELIFYANIHFTRIKDTWCTQNPCENILLLSPFSHFIMLSCKLMTIFDWTVNIWDII